MTIVLEKGGAGGPVKGLAPAHFFPLEGTGYSKTTFAPKHLDSKGSLK